MPFPVIPYIAAGLAALAAVGAASVKPQVAVEGLRWKVAQAKIYQGRATAQLANPYAVTGIVFTLPPVDVAAQIAGSEASTAYVGEGLTPVQVITQINHLDMVWGQPLADYARRHDMPMSTTYVGMGGRPIGQPAIRVYPVRWAALRATVDADLMGHDPLADFADAPITDPQTGKLKDSWLRLVAFYSPTPQDWQITADQVSSYYSKPPSESRGWLDGISSIIGIAQGAITGQFGAAAKGAAALLKSSPQAPGYVAPSRKMSLEEIAIFDILQSKKTTATLTFKNKAGTGRNLVECSWWEALSGGGIPLSMGLMSLANSATGATGKGILAATLRTSPDVLPDSKTLDDDALSLKAILIARRNPVSGSQIYSQERSPYPNLGTPTSSTPLKLWYSGKIR